MIFTVRQLQKKCLEQRQDLCLLFIDLTKAFGTFSRPGLWSLLSKLGCPSKFISMVRSLHDGMMARVTENGDVSDPFPVTNGVKQGSSWPQPSSESESEYLLSQYRFTRKFVLRCTVSDIINTNNLTRLQRLKIQYKRWKYVSIRTPEGNLGLVIIPCGQWFFIFTSPAPPA